MPPVLRRDLARLLVDLVLGDALGEVPADRRHALARVLLRLGRTAARKAAVSASRSRAYGGPNS